MSSIQETNLKAIADAIRAKEKSTGVIQASKFAERIAAIQSGITPKLIVTTSAGAAVTATKGSNTVNGTAGTDGTCTLELPEAGEWSVTSTANGLSSTLTIMIGTQALQLLLIDPVFANNTWEGIIVACHTGQVPSDWAVGNSKTMTINGTDYQIDIIGKNHDDYADGSGKAPLTFQLHDCYGTVYAMNTSNTNVGGWKSSAMRSTHLPAILALMPTEVQSGIRAVNKKTSSGGSDATIETVSDKLFLLCEAEIFDNTYYSEVGEGTQYDYYRAGNSKLKNQNGSKVLWWERSPTRENYETSHACFCLVSRLNDGDFSNDNADTSHGVSFAFCF